MMNGIAYFPEKSEVPLCLPRLINLLAITIPYKGLLLTEDVRLLHSGKDYGVFQALNQPLYVSLKEQVYLHGPGLPNPMKAFIEEINLNRGWITLSRFKPLDSIWKDRREERVQPSKPLHIRLHNRSTQCLGSIDNISKSGMGILVDQKHGKDLLPEIGAKVKLDFVWEERQIIHLNAVLISVKPIGQSLAKIGLTTQPGRKLQETLNRYIKNRKLEIMDELDSKWFNWQYPRTTKELFF